MIEGIAASISTAVPKGLRNHEGASSVKNIAIPNDTGIAIASAMREVSNVPIIGTNAPNSLWTGSHSFVHKKDKPYLASVSLLP